MAQKMGMRPPSRRKENEAMDFDDDDGDGDSNEYRMSLCG